MIKQNTLLVADKLGIAFPSQREAGKNIVRDVNFTLNTGEVMAIVGESGSGKTMIARSILGLLPSGGYISAGSVSFRNTDIASLSSKELQAIRGQEISMIFQEPMVSLNPTLKIGYQMCEASKHHTDKPYADIWTRAVDLLQRVQITDAEACMNKYPHEFSGGMRQRIMIASSLMMKPALLIADEPTTALDCLVQKEILDILLDITKQEGTSVLLITHDLGLVAHYADKVLVMEKGNAVEQGVVKNILEKPTHPYTRKLLSSLPHRDMRPDDSKEKTPAVAISSLCVDYPIRRKWFWQEQQYNRVLKNIDLKVMKGETLAVVGESGSGKTTLGRAILQLVGAAEGSIFVGDTLVTGDNPPGFRAMRDRIQLIFQDPFSALSPRETIGAIISEPLALQKGLSKEEIQTRTRQMLVDVGLDASYETRYPNELSGGQRQRISIARALIGKPEIVIADEPVSALDITVQAQILKLLDELKVKHGFTCIFISHDLGVVEQVADRIVVMYHGHIVEWGKADSLLEKPAHSYTQQLLAALPELKPAGENSYKLHRRSAPDFSYPEGKREFISAPEGEQEAAPQHVEIAEGHFVACTSA